MYSPGHNYLGPRNDLNSAVPVDSDDEIARKHDKTYHEAECNSDVYRADEIAIFSFMIDRFLSEIGTLKN